MGSVANMMPLLTAPHGHGGSIMSTVVPQAINAAVLRLLKHSTVNDVGGGKVRSTGEVVTVDSRDTVEAALTRMTEKNVLSVPVWDAGAGPVKGEGKFIAVLHLMDM